MILLFIKNPSMSFKTPGVVFFVMVSNYYLNPFHFDLYAPSGKTPKTQQLVCFSSLPGLLN